MARKTPAAPKPGRLERNVDAVLLGRGLQLNSSVEKVLVRSKRTKFVPFKKGHRPPGRKKATRRRAGKGKPQKARAKQLRAARRKGPGK